VSAENERLGSVAEEASRLFEAVQDWARRAGVDGRTQIATGAPECRLCPLCQALGLLRDARPEVVEHLVTAVGSLAAAVRVAVDASEREWSARRPAHAEHIDIG
jgi:Family of unknown function (DUF5304)